MRRCDLWYGMLICLVLGICSGCTTARYDVPLPLAVSNRTVTQFERDMGNAAWQMFDHQYKIERESSYQKRADEILAKIVPHVHMPKIPYRIVIVDAGEVKNAAALPDGSIFVMRAVMSSYDKDEYVAALVCHELAHVNLEHGLQHNEKYGAESRSEARKENIYEVLLASFTLGMVNPTDEGMDLLTQRQFSLQHEVQADVLGTYYLAKAGYDPYAMIRLQEALADKTLFVPLIFRTHPFTKERKKFIERYITEELHVANETV